MRCLQAQCTARSDALISLTEQHFHLALERCITLSSCYIRGRENGWAEALSWLRGMSVKWHLDRRVFEALTGSFGTPEVDLFAFRTTTQVPTFLSFSQRMQAVGLDAQSQVHPS